MGLFYSTHAEKQAARNAEAAAAGRGPSAARSQLAQGLNQSQNFMSAQAAGVRQNPLAAMRMAQQQGAQMAGQTQMQAAQIRSQEQQAGQQALAGIAAQDAAAQNQLVGGLMNMGATAMSAGLAGAAPAAASLAAPMVENLKGGKSDIRAKTAIQDGAPQADRLIENLAPYQYQYRDPQRDGGGARLGVMAQDLQRADPRLVQRGRDGQLSIDGPRALSANLAVSARLAQRLNAVEAAQRPGLSEYEGGVPSGFQTYDPSNQHTLTQVPYQTQVPRVASFTNRVAELENQRLSKPKYAATFTPAESAQRLAQSLERKRIQANDLAYAEHQRVTTAPAPAPVASRPEPTVVAPNQPLTRWVAQPPRVRGGMPAGWTEVPIPAPEPIATRPVAPVQVMPVATLTNPTGTMAQAPSAPVATAPVATAPVVEVPAARTPEEMQLLTDRVNALRARSISNNRATQRARAAQGE